MISRLYNSLKIARILALLGVGFLIMIAGLAVIGLDTRVAENTRATCSGEVFLVIKDAEGVYGYITLAEDDVLTDDLKQATITAKCSLEEAENAVLALNDESYSNFKDVIVFAIPFYGVLSLAVILHWAHLEHRFRQKKKSKQVKTYFKSSKK